ncbi:similar to Saccharomyces cerevisiae YOR011W (ohnolog of YIL013C PDR11) AUS1 Plasma membrane sterol transporter of the ATP-binding cassette family [Maudiozyma barnettii]|uniref:Similar to Saccharomyces cerevisiae YOR011W (Ohnolog of YIL013C PDR11) AUS1 Plasma membrane sterol transporter of the ATP-binding cassette family n=1 Tax=Maudiozyma barnettii TaxID=61262 RepID=A0A8H2ZHL7_9SACH|nr:uncharacterized protein KABA2_03S11902 [Kazachstania barnettii]CAB4254073.1 similar to Saccharomyces cerevisiae YOR011W (ohnolog of YIL013C PDR11) AUS1 Plasma membrane sterol transporter of the ATP-binding cassette family [Kazachstania barnettii]CAD1781823.1 similar to Saccharomyces cerevisiae YOR011W (ohnolog of YIL013C PDR11) AUS1 Plasma membrane sterol transporter of the ATP-binding cassette family [Kazachstania barnettii]
MSISKYFTPVSDASVTFDNCDIKLDTTTISNEDGAASNTQINDITFRAEGGEMVLVLGNPTSAFFKTLFHGHKDLNYSPAGSARFKENDFKQFSIKCPHQIVYNNEQDIHFPFLTVEQTIDFALSCKFDLPKSERDSIRDELLKEFGLSHVLKTIVGNDFFRGVSGGERKRISIIETFIANGSVYLWDNSTKGLDSSTALDFLSILQNMTRATNSVNFVKISQASDKIVNKFDKILMFTDSYQVFYGTLDECMSYFSKDLGIPKNPNDCIIEYLTSILNFQFKNQNNHMTTNWTITATDTADISDSSTDLKAKTNVEITDVSSPSTNIRNEFDLHRYWISSAIYENLKRITSSVSSNETHLGNVNTEDITTARNIPLSRQIKLVTKRAFQRSLGDKIYLSAQLMSVIIQSLVIGSLFYDIPLNTIGSYSRGSLTFFSLLFFTFLSLAEMPAAFQRQPVIGKQTQLHFYYSWVEVLATTTFDYCYKLLLVIVFSILLYFLAHLQFNAARYFIFLLFLSIYNFSMVSLFSLTALMTPTLSIANLFAGILLLAIAMYASYVIYLANMHPWFVWIAYINPARYAMETILSNELFNLKLDCRDTIIPRGDTYNNVSFSNKACAWRGATLGNDYVRGRDYLDQGLEYAYNHTWRNFGILIAFLVFFVGCTLFAAQYIKPLYQDGHWKKVLTRYFPFIARHANVLIDETDPDKEIIAARDLYYDNPSDFSTGLGKETNSFDIKSASASESGISERVETQSHIISWKNINYTVEGDKQLIDNVSGYISSGLTALMGESGAGKTTLLNVLSQRTESGVVEGDILIDGKPLTDIDSFRRSIGFVQQQDLHLEKLTVYESLEISCLLRGDGDKTYINTISDLLKLPLNKLVATLTPTQKKLLSIGVELVTKPSLLLFLDEPTSGLDAEAALTIVQFLKKLSMQGQAIFCTIHQPSKSVISYFDNIFLLKRGGECVYFGPTEQACDYFTHNDRSLTYDTENENPADFIIDVVGSNDGNLNEEKHDIKIGPSKWSQTWNHSPERTQVEQMQIKLEEEAVMSGVDFTQNVWKQPSYMEQLMVISKRQYTVTARDKTYVAAKYLLNAGAGLFIGFSFWNIKPNISGLQDTIFFCFMALCVSSPLINQVQDKALQSKEVYVAREARSNTFHWSILLLAQLVIELPLAITSSSLFYVCAFFCCKFDNSPHIAGVWYFNYIIFAAYYLTFGLWLIFTAPNLQTAAVFVAFFYSFTASFCGVMQPYGMFPGFWKFMYRVSPYTYFIDTFVSLLLHDREVICDNMELVPGQPTIGQTCGQFMEAYIDEFGGYLKNANTMTVCGYCTYSVGDDFLEVEGMSYNNRWRNFGIECAFVAFNIFGMFMGYYLTYLSNFWPLLFKFIKKAIPSRKMFQKK